jgi:hypothetical protein
MRILTFIAGVVCLFAALFDAFQTIILPRRATGRFRLTRIFYVSTWRPWVFFTRRLRDARKRESAFSYYGPMSLIFLLAMWAAATTIGFALIYYALGNPRIGHRARPSCRRDGIFPCALHCVLKARSEHFPARRARWFAADCRGTAQAPFV